MNSSHCIALMILSPEIWSERKTREMSSTIVCPVLFKQIASEARHRDREIRHGWVGGLGGTKSKRVCSVLKGYASSKVFVLSITGDGCQESGEIKVNNSGKCVCICTIQLIAWQTSGRARDTQQQ